MTEEAAFGAKKTLSWALEPRCHFHPHTTFTTSSEAIDDKDYGDGSVFLGWFREFMNICLHECQISQLYRTEEEQRGSVRGENLKSTAR